MSKIIKNDYKRKEELKYLIPQVNEELRKKYPDLVSILDLDRTELECIHDIYNNDLDIYDREVRILLNLIVYKKKGIRNPLKEFVQLDELTTNNGPTIQLDIINNKGQESTKQFYLGDGDDGGAVMYSKGNKAYIWLRWWRYEE